jgi:hypothetical protein
LTPYPDVDAAIGSLLDGAQTALGASFVGMYLHGSLASGDFRPETGDIDFLVATDKEVRGGALESLRALHAQLAADDPVWGPELEGSYIPRDALRRHDPSNARHPHIERGERLRLERHWSDWVLQRHVLREQGLTLAGPPPETLIDPVGPDELRAAVRGIVREWWAPFIAEPTRLEQDGYRAYAVLTMCRALHTVEHGTIVPKREAAAWSAGALPARWSQLIRRAASWVPGAQLEGVHETLPFMAFAVAAVGSSSDG